MIKLVRVVVTFPMGAKFVGNVNVDVYRRLIGFIKDLMCFNPSSKCVDCPKKQQCRYYKMTGENFAYYPGALVHNELFEKKHYKSNEQKEFLFYFVGNNEIYKDYVEFFFEQMRQSLFGNFFYLNSVSSNDMENECVHIKRASIITPIESTDLKNAYNEMALYYNAKYDTDFKLLKSAIETDNIRNIKWDVIRLKTRNIKVNGYIFKINNDEIFDKRLLTIGMGKYNYIGGGQIEIKD